MSTAEEEARELLERISDHATWEDIMCRFYVEKKKIETMGDLVTASFRSKAI
jgi:hypothetical protein